ncbi:hypothetical protein BY996DRAFT_6440639 [Phakopsora pachyrhizi]|nr:hypothetical protein BY996DRAFT_6440639 [Phakopsora pachyrhizi]
MEDTGYEALEDRKPSRKDPLRIQVICAAVQEGSLPASALENELRQDSSIDDDDENEGNCVPIIELQHLLLPIFIKSSTLPGTISGIETELCPFLEPCEIPNCSPYSAGEVLG